MIEATIDLARGRAFIPDPLDTLVPLAHRFRGRPLVAVTLYKDALEAVGVTFIGHAPKFGGSEFCQFGAEGTEVVFLQSFAEKANATECVLVLATGYTASLTSRARNADNDVEAVQLMRDNPAKLLGDEPAHGARHSIAFHPTHNFAINFAHKVTEIECAMSLAAKAGLGVARLQCGMSSLLIHVMDHFWSDVGREAELLFVERTSLFTLSVGETVMGKPLFEMNLKEAALQTALGERIGKMKPQCKVVLVNASKLDVENMIHERGLNAVVIQPMKSLPQPVLAACCGDLPRLGYDLYTSERAVRPFAPARLRFVPVSFWGSVALFAIIMSVNWWRGHVALAEARASDLRMAQTNKEITASSVLVNQVEQRRKTSDAVRDWLSISPPAQNLLIALTKEIEAGIKEAVKDNKATAQLESMSFTRLEGQPQMRLVIVVLGDAPTANRIFQRVSAQLGNLGYKTGDLKTTIAPNGFRYEHLLNIPNPFATP